MSSGVVYPTTTIPTPGDVEAHTNQLFDFNDDYLVQSDIRQTDFVRIFDRSGGGNVADKKHFLFQMNDIASGNAWYCPSRSFIKVDFRVNRGDNGATPPIINADPQTFASDLRAIFSRVRFGMGGQTITDIPDFFWVLPAQENQWWTDQYTETVGKQMLCFPTRNNQPGNNQETGNYDEQVVVSNTPNNALVNNYNSYQNSIGKRIYLSGNYLPTPSTNQKNGTILSAFIPLYHLSSVLQFFDKATSQIQWELELYLHGIQSIQTYTNTVPATEPPVLELVNNGIELWARRITPTATAQLVLTEQMNRGVDMAIKFADLQIYKEVIDSGDGQPAGTNIPFDFRVTVTANRPVFAIVLFQSPDNINTYGYEYDCFNHANVDNIALLVNNVQLPTDRIECRLNEEKVFTQRYPYVFEPIDIDQSRPYYEYLRAAGNYKAPYLQGFSAGAGTLNALDWKNRCPSYNFDCATRQIGQWAGGSSEIRIRGAMKIPNGANIQSATYNVWTLLYTERQLGVHLQNWNSYVAVA